MHIYIYICIYICVYACTMHQFILIDILLVQISIFYRCNYPSGICHRLLDLSGPLQLGGLPWIPLSGHVSQKDFIGCISDVYIDDQLLDLNKPVVNVQTDVGCLPKMQHCLSTPCVSGGR